MRAAFRNLAVSASWPSCLLARSGGDRTKQPRRACRRVPGDNPMLLRKFRRGRVPRYGRRVILDLVCWRARPGMRSESTPSNWAKSAYPGSFDAVSRNPRPANNRLAINGTQLRVPSPRPMNFEPQGKRTLMCYYVAHAGVWRFQPATRTLGVGQVLPRSG
jgi:hypothetical protein